LSLLFTFCIPHSYLPNSTIEIEFIPLVKDKSSDITDVNNYRAIALANVETKLLEILDKVKMDNNYTDYQSAFINSHSTALCTSAVKQTIEYYINRGSHVFACFVTFSKAFDNVNYRKLFK